MVDCGNFFGDMYLLPIFPSKGIYSRQDHYAKESHHFLVCAIDFCLGAEMIMALILLGCGSCATCILNFADAFWIVSMQVCKPTWFGKLVYAWLLSLQNVNHT